MALAQVLQDTVKLINVVAQAFVALKYEAVSNNDRIILDVTRLTFIVE